MSIAPFDVSAYVPWNALNSWTYTSVRNTGNVAVLLPRAAEYPGRYAEAAPSNMVYVRADTEVAFGFGELGTSGIVPKPGDRVQNAGGPSLVVVSVVQLPRLLRHKVTARDLVLAYDLRDAAIVKRSNPAPGNDGGVRDRNPTTLAANVPCRMQPLQMTVEFEEDRVEQHQTFRAYLGQPLLLVAGDTISVGGAEYEVTGQGDISRIDTLSTADCEYRG